MKFRKCLSLILVVLVMLTTVIAGQSVCYAEEGAISVYIDGEKLDFDVSPVIRNNRVMVPVRKIFEHLGADVEWNPYTKSIISTCGYLAIRMQMDVNQMNLNGNYIELDAPPIAVDNRTLVPLRAVAEAFKAEVRWDPGTNSVVITTKYPRNKYVYNEEFDKYHIKTANGPYEFFEFTLDGTTMNIYGKLDNKEINSLNIVIGDGVMRETYKAKKNGYFDISLDLSDTLIKEDTPVKLYTGTDGGTIYNGYIWKTLYINRRGSNIFFKESLVWENNKAFMEKWVNPICYVTSSIDPEVVELSDTICRNAATDYDKVMKIHDWVCENIYYNYDYYYGNKAELVYGATEVLDKRVTVCEGYANLTMALINAQGIPCRKLAGYALGLSASSGSWTRQDASTTNSNHAWNQAYVDNRWINIDTTWDSNNKYVNERFDYAEMKDRLYFDTSDVFFSYDHKIIRLD